MFDPTREPSFPRRRPRPDILSAAMQQVAEGVIIADRAGRFVFWNAAAERILGKPALSSPPSEWSSIYGCFLPDGVTPFPSQDLPLARAIRGEHVREAEVLIRSAGWPRATCISVNGGPLHGNGGELLGGVVVFRDVTAHREADELVRQLSKAIENTTDAVFITDTNAVIE
jgi:PAS domain-containing protein